jgi:hypothetical protein
MRQFVTTESREIADRELCDEVFCGQTRGVVRTFINYKSSDGAITAERSSGAYMILWLALNPQLSLRGFQLR